MTNPDDRTREPPSALIAAGWTLRIGASSVPSQATDRPDIYAIYRGEAYGRPARGILAAVARGIGANPAAAREAAQIALHMLAEGYFGAGPTLSAGRAAALALASANAWMFAQANVESASLAALIFCGRHVGVLYVGDCRVYRLRGGQITPLSEDHVRPLPDGTHVLSRSVGGDADLHLDYIEDAPEPSDRYVIMTKGADAGLAQLAQRLSLSASAQQAADSLAARGAAAADAAAVVIDAVQLPQVSFDELSASFLQLPLRGAPRDGENWDGFILGRTLYRSRYTTLKLAQDTLGDREVVLKIPLPSMLHDEVFRAGFLREAWVGASVHSPRIASYIDVPAERRSSLYLVLPYYRGETLEARLIRPPPIAYLEGVGLALKLCAAVSDLAVLQIVHRDLKPDNVLLLPDGEIKLLDLGLAYLPGVDEPDDDRLGGTTRYMAPELFRKMPADQCSEVFSLGVTIYRLFSGGAFPFGQRETLPLERLRPDLPAWLGECLKKALENDRAKRFQDTGELAQALKDGLSQGAATPAVARRRSWRVAPLRIWQALAALFALAFFVALFLLLRR